MPYLLLVAALLTMLIQSFVVSTIVKGLILSYVFILVQALVDLFRLPLRKATINIYPGLMLFVIGFVAYQALAQLLNVIYLPSFAELPMRVLVSPENPDVAVMRASLFTQSAYLITCVAFFLYVYKYIASGGAPERVIRIARIGVLAYVLYGFVEFTGFLITGGSVDFISNRITGVDSHYGTFQTITVGGFVIERMKSLAGEPSMFAFSIVPFVIFFYYLKDRIYLLLLVAALLSTSTTAILGLALFGLIEAVVFRRFFRVAGVAAAIVAIVVLVDPTIITSLADYTVTKLSLQNSSGIDRFDNLTSSLSLFAGSDFFHLLFGYGFGYIRSTDGFSTLLVNTGLFGLLMYGAFSLYPLLKLTYDSGYRKALLVSNVVLLILVMVSVPEFYYFHVWFLAALSWYEYLHRPNPREAQL